MCHLRQYSVMFFEKYVIPVLRWLFTIGIPTLLICAAIVVFLKMFIFPAFFSDRKKKQYDALTTVLRKREEVLSNASGIYSLYYVIFSLENDSIEFSVPKKIYESLFAGDKGLLSYYGDQFSNFVVTEKSEKVKEGEILWVGDTMRSTLNIIEQKERE